VAVETADSWQLQAVELVQELGRQVIRRCRRLQETPTCSSNYQWLCKRETDSALFQNTFTDDFTEWS